MTVVPYSLLFWGDRDGNGIYRIPVNGARKPKKVTNILCPFSMALSYNTGNIYTVDSCIQLLKSSKIDGSNQEVIIPNIGSGFVYGSSVFGDRLFWSQASSVSVVKYFNIKMGTSHEIFQRSMNIFYDVMVVHSSNQPPGIITSTLLVRVTV